MRIIFEDPAKAKQAETKAREQLRKAIQPALESMNKVSEGVLFKKETTPETVEKELGFSDVPETPIVKRDPILDALYEFFDFNPWTGEGERKNKINDLASYLSTRNVDTRGKALQHLRALAFKMGSSNLFETKLEQFHKYVKVKQAAEDINREVKAYEK